MVYTCYEMMRDCRANLPQGWSHFIAAYVPVIRRLLAHYRSRDAPPVEPTVAALCRPQSSLFQSLEPSPERCFVAELRQQVLAELPDGTAPEISLDLDAVAAALAAFTMVEKQAAWLETMRYSAAQAAEMLRMSAQTVDKIRNRAADQIRGQVDAWNRGLLEANGAALGRAAAAAGSKDCPPVKLFLDVLDGRATWSSRAAIEQHVTACWHCIDHYCRLLEVAELLRGVQPLPEAEAEPFRRLLGLPAAKLAGWKRWTGWFGA